MRKFMKKFLLLVIMTIIVTSLAKEKIVAKETTISTKTATAYHAYLGFQTNTYVFRDSWNHEYYGLNSNYLYYNSEIGYWENNFLERMGVSIENADIISDGTYSISISDINLKTLNVTGFNTLYISTDIPCSKKGISFSDVTLSIDDTIIAICNVVPQKGDEKNYYQLMLADSYAPEDGTIDCKYDKNNIFDVLPENNIKITFTIDGLDNTNDSVTDNGNQNGSSASPIPPKNENIDQNSSILYTANYDVLSDCKVYQGKQTIITLPNVNETNVYIKITVSDIRFYKSNGDYVNDIWQDAGQAIGIINGKEEFWEGIYGYENYNKTVKLGNNNNKFIMKGEISSSWDYFTCKVKFTKIVKKEPEKKQKKIDLNKKSLTLYVEGIFKTLKLKNADESKVHWKSSNRKIAKCNQWGEVTPIHPGKCKITAIYNGKKYVCKVNVKLWKSFKMWAKLYKYDTRKNVFYVEFTNYSNKKMIVLANDAIAVDSDYTTFDRQVYLSKKVVIKPGKKKKIKFYVKGNVTWYNVSDFCVNYWVKWKNQNKRIATDDECCYVRKGKKWKSVM